MKNSSLGYDTYTKAQCRLSKKYYKRDFRSWILSEGGYFKRDGSSRISWWHLAYEFSE